MPDYIASRSNRFYALREASYAKSSLPSQEARIVGTKLQVAQHRTASQRQDKSGCRTTTKSSTLLPAITNYSFSTYLSYNDAPTAPAYGCLFEATLGCLGATGRIPAIDSASSGTQIRTVSPHALNRGDGVAQASEIRFVDQVLDPLSFSLNAPFSAPIDTNTAMSPVTSYRPGDLLPSVTIYDYWDPAPAVSRALIGAAVEELRIGLEGDRHEFEFSGHASGLADNAGTVSADLNLVAFPPEPLPADLDTCGVPGHFGQIWINGQTGDSAVVTHGEIRIQNAVHYRNSEFGWSNPRLIVPGARYVTVDLVLLPGADSQSAALHEAATSRTPVSLMLQLGIEQGGLLGLYLPEVLLNMPDFEDASELLQWRIVGSVAQGASNDEIFLAFA